GAAPALLEGHAERRELALHPADACAEDETTAGHHVDTGQELGHWQRGPVRKDDYARPERDPLGDAGEPGKDGQGVEHLRAVGDEDIPGHDDVVGHPERVEPQGVRALRHLEQTTRLEGAAVVRKAEPDLHGVSSGRLFGAETVTTVRATRPAPA